MDGIIDENNTKFNIYIDENENGQYYLIEKYIPEYTKH